MSVTISVVRTAPTPNSTKSVIPNGLKENKPSFYASPKKVDPERWIKAVKWMGDDFDSAMQRLVSGVTAIVTQPFFDLYNKKTDEKTRQTSCARTMGKIIAGTLTGVLIREGCIQLVHKFTQSTNYNQELMTRENLKENGKKLNLRMEFKPWEQCLLTEAARKKATFREIKKYRGAVGTFAAVFIMIFTNFLIDAPLTTYLTNKFTKLFGIQPPEKHKEMAIEGGMK